jgi:hypothetical protein
MIVSVRFQPVVILLWMHEKHVMMDSIVVIEFHVQEQLIVEHELTEYVKLVVVMDVIVAVSKKQLSFHWTILLIDLFLAV